MDTKEKERNGETMRLVMLGPPGSGKGTYSIRLSSSLGIPHISTGQIFRDNMAQGTELGYKVKQFMDAGHLVPDEITNAVVKDRISKPDCAKGFIFDGYPRTLAQAKELDKMSKIDVALYLDIPEDILVEKALARRICKDCGDIYNLADIHRQGIRMPPMLPKKAGLCDKCGGVLISRGDDTPDKIKERLRVQQVPPEIIKFYDEKKVLHRVKVDSPPEEMVPKILEMLKKFK